MTKTVVTVEVPPPRDIQAVHATTARRVWLQYADGRAGEVDLTPMLRGPLFAAVRGDDALFAKVFVDDVGTLAWPDGADLVPEGLYELAAPHLLAPAPPPIRPSVASTPEGTEHDRRPAGRPEH